MKHLVITECVDSIPIAASLRHDTLTPVEADELSTYILNNELDEDGIIISRHNVTFINYVGFIQLSTCSIEILPKVSGGDPAHSRRVLLRILQRTGYLDIHESQISQLTIEKLDLYEIIAYLFVAKLSNEIRKGVFHSYQEDRDDLQLIRGKIDITRQILRESAKLSGVSCVYDEFHRDNPLNQIMKAALQITLARCAYTETRKRATHCLMLLDDVGDVPVDRNMLDSILFNRTNRRFQDSFNLAKLLLTHSAPVSSQGRRRNSSLLFKMNDLFEAYIALLAQNVSDRVTVKDRRYKLLIKEDTGRGAFQLEPDLLIENQMGKQIIVDNKWKFIQSRRSRHGVKREDFYQMYAYLTRYKEVDTVILLYPHHDEVHHASGHCLESWYLEEQSAKKLKVYSIDYEDEQKAEQELFNIINDANLNL
ncbi:MAG: McrC family protein [Bacillota bacterium]